MCPKAGMSYMNWGRGPTYLLGTLCTLQTHNYFGINPRLGIFGDFYVFLSFIQNAPIYSIQTGSKSFVDIFRDQYGTLNTWIIL